MEWGNERGRTNTVCEGGGRMSDTEAMTRFMDAAARRADYEWYRRYFRDFLQFASPRCAQFGYGKGQITGEPTSYASGFEALLAFADLVDDTNAVILDAGAGASSFVLRRWFPNVISTDGDAEFLESVRRTCVGAGLGGEQFIVGIENCPEADFTFWDYSSQERTLLFPLGLMLTRREIYCDDADDRPVSAWRREYFYKFANALDLPIRDVPESRDQYGRFGAVITNTKVGAGRGARAIAAA